MEPSINQDLDSNLRLDLTPALFTDLGWELNQGTATTRGGTCDTSVPVVVAPGITVGANLQAADAMCRETSGSAAGYRSELRQLSASRDIALRIELARDAASWRAPAPVVRSPPAVAQLPSPQATPPPQRSSAAAPASALQPGQDLMKPARSARTIDDKDPYR
jgi:hypothetical protein